MSTQPTKKKNCAIAAIVFMVGHLKKGKCLAVWFELAKAKSVLLLWSMQGKNSCSHNTLFRIPINVIAVATLMDTKVEDKIMHGSGSISCWYAHKSHIPWKSNRYTKRIRIEKRDQTNKSAVETILLISKFTLFSCVISF